MIDGLIIISRLHPSIIKNVTLPLLFHNLPDGAPPQSAKAARDRYRSVLDSLSRLCIQPALFQSLVIRIVSKLDLLSPSPETSADSDIDTSATEVRECNVAYAWDLLDCLATVIDAKLESKHVDVIKYFNQIIPRLFGLAVNAAMTRTGEADPIFRDRRLLGLLGRIAETLTWELNVECVFIFSRIVGI